MDAGALEFRSGYFHHALCGFGIGFLPDMAGALREWARVTRPGGRILYTCHGPNAFRSMADMLLARLERRGIAPPAEGPAGEWEDLRRPEICRALLAAAGLAETEVRTERIATTCGRRPGGPSPSTAAWGH
ncbi:methyltransferase [Sulfurifustis variabilis]|uniref:Methyltransferase n=1 Tax=Sulfurifustis variabilis TaxID=1675686 RepID=A0A1B4V5N6_9GAMM|nr:methyltransferase [Sulfurifustis variabilis]